MPKPEAHAVSIPRWLAPVLLTLTGLFLLGLLSTELADTDAWWHLATGRYIVSAHRLPTPDPFAYTTAGARAAYPSEDATRAFNLTHEWLTQCLMYLVAAGGGLGAVVFGRALLLVAACGLTGFVAWRRTASLSWAIAAALAAGSLAVEFAHDRPSIVSFLFTALFIAICEERRPLWTLPVLAVLWANCHGGFFLGWLVMGAYALEAAVRRMPQARRMGTAAALAVLASGANPNGFGVVKTLLAYRNSPMTATLIEWAHASLWGSPYAFDLLLYGAALTLALSWKKVRLSDWVLFAVFAAAALTAFRNEMLIGLLAPVLIAAYFPWKRALPAIALYGAAAALAGGLIWGTTRGAFFQFRAAEWRFPAGAADFLRERQIAGPIFNTYEYGGYLIWRGERVFIDGRALSEAVFQDYRVILGAPPGDPARDTLLARYGVNAIVVNAFEYNSGVLYHLVLALAQPAEAEWKLAYDDAESLVFLRDPAGSLAALDKSLIFDHLENECRLHMEREPELSLCARTLGNLFLKGGDLPRARRALGLYLEHPYPDDPDPRRVYNQLLQHP